MRDLLKDIPELARMHAGEGLIRIPQGCDVPFTPRVRAVIDTPEFQRLRHVSQLGLVALIYPGATHSRFEHSLGVFHHACRYVLQLARDQRFCQLVDVHDVEVLLAAALLHDVGHWPFCHPIEDLRLRELPEHEQFAEYFVNEQSELGKALLSEWSVQPREVLDLLANRGEDAKARLLSSILSGPIDVDKMDYLERDSQNAGVPYGQNYDRNRLIESLVLNQAGDGLAITSKGKTAAELMVFARYVMFSEVYWHHAVRSATAMFIRGFYELRHEVEVDDLFRMSEPEMVRTLREKSQKHLAESLIEGVFGPRRMLYKRLAEFGDREQQELYKSVAGRPYHELVALTDQLRHEINQRTGLHLTSTQMVIDAPPVRKEVEFTIEVYDRKRDVYRQLSEVSPVVEALAKKQFDDFVKRVRVFIAPAHRDSISKNIDVESLLLHLLKH